MKRIRGLFKIVTVAFILLCTQQGFASPQFPDIMIYKSDTIPVYSLILEQYLQKLESPTQGSLLGLEFREGASLNCWRGYQAIYLIENDSLFLKEIISCGELRSGRPINHETSMKRKAEIFEDQVKNGKVFIDWYSGELSFPKGKILRWDGVFHTTFEKETLVKVEEGKIKDFIDVANYEDEPDRIDRRYGDKISDLIFKELEKIRWKSVDKFDCSERYFIKIGKDGRVNEVAMTEYQSKEEIEEYWDRNEYNYCIRTIKKRLKGLKFDILKRNGKPIEETVQIGIWLEDDGKLENWTY